ncbi:hypothetical protein D3C80_1468020 [compost metagenome]
MGIQHLLKLSVYKRTLIRTGAAQFNTEGSHRLHHFLLTDLTAATGTRFPVHFTCRLRAAHDSSGSMNGAVVSISVLYAVLTFDDHGYISHAASYKTDLAWCGRGCTLSDDNNLFSVVQLFPGVVMMIMHFHIRFGVHNR